MKITLEITTKVVDLQAAGGIRSVPARVWEGTTERGTPVIAFITRIALARTDPTPEEVAEFERDLRETTPPHLSLGIPMRLIL